MSVEMAGRNFDWINGRNDPYNIAVEVSNAKGEWQCLIHYST